MTNEGPLPATSSSWTIKLDCYVLAMDETMSHPSKSSNFQESFCMEAKGCFKHLANDAQGPCRSAYITKLLADAMKRHSACSSAAKESSKTADRPLRQHAPSGICVDVGGRGPCSIQKWSKRTYDPACGFAGDRINPCNCQPHITRVPSRSVLRLQDYSAHACDLLNVGMLFSETSQHSLMSLELWLLQDSHEVALPAHCNPNPVGTPIPGFLV